MRELLKRVSKRFPFLVLLLFSLVIAGCAAGDDTGRSNGESNHYANDEEIADAEASAFSSGENKEYGPQELMVQFLDVGQGSAALICQNGSYMLVDGGDRDYSSYVVSYLKKLGIEKLDYVVVSHYDSDHLSGIVGVLNALECKQVLAPEYEEDTKIYESFLKVVQEKKISLVHPKPGAEYAFAYSSFRIVGPEDVYDDANSNSLGIRLQYGDNSFLICGDCTAESEMDILYQGVDIDSDVFAANHHGSKYSNTEEFLEAVDPDYVVVSCGKGNSYGHPNAPVLLSVQKLGAALYRTDLQGTITAVSDGETIRFENEICMDYRSGAEIREELKDVDSGTKDTTSNSEDTASKSEDMASGSEDTASEQDKTGATYIINANSKKFHLPDCSSAADMDDKNKEYSDDSRESLIEQGYSPCKRCNP